MEKETQETLLALGVVVLIAGVYLFATQEKPSLAAPTPPKPAPTTPGALVTVTKPFTAADLATGFLRTFGVGEKITMSTSALGATSFFDTDHQPAHLYTTTEAVYGAA